MSEYLYKVTGKTRTLPDGTKANIAVFAYKPWTEKMLDDTGRKINKQLYYQTGCYRADRYVKSGKTFTGKVVLDGCDIAVPWSAGTITDYTYDNIIDSIRRKENNV
jgi:hypothetical protein